MDRLTKEERRAVVDAFIVKYGEDPNFNEVAMRYNLWDGDWIQVKVKDIWATQDYPDLFNGLNVFVEEAPPVTTPLPQD